MKILTLNIYLRPYFINSYTYSIKSYINNKCKFKDIFHGDFKNQRLDQLFLNIKKEKYDIICLQEFFCDYNNYRVNKIKKFAIDNNYFLSLPLNKNNIIFASSGLCILSKYNILKKKFIKFNCNSYFPNKFVDSGYQHIKIIYNEKIVNILNVHLQSGKFNYQHQVRINQINEISNYIKKNIKNNEIVILNGDFNANKELWLKLYKLLPNYIDPFKGKFLNDSFTFRKFNSNEVQRFDGILFYDKNKEFLIKTEINPINIKKVGYFESISDHYALITNLKKNE